MKRRNIFFRIRAGIHGRRAKMKARKLSSMILDMIFATQETELGCDDVNQELHHYTDAFLSGDDVAKKFPLIHHHLQTCPDCASEFDTVVRLVRKAGSATKFQKKHGN